MHTSRLFVLALPLALAPLARAQWSTAPVSSDPIDTAQGTIVTNATAGIAPGPEAAIGTNLGGPEPGTCFCPDVGLGNAVFIEIATTAPVTLGGVHLYGKNDGAINGFRRAMSGFNVLADTDNNGSFETAVSATAINPDYDNEPANLALSSEYLELAITFPPVTASAWRLEFIQGTQIGSFEGIRIIEVDGVAGSCPAAVNYCTAGTTTNGCTPSLTASAASASLSAGPGSFVLTANGVEGQKSGLIFYGVNGRNAIPWGTGSTSFLCVKPPTQRTPPQSTGGTAATCNGMLNADFFQYILVTNPGALGNPPTVGTVYDAQAWFRDPPAPKTTNLSNGLEFTLCP